MKEEVKVEEEDEQKEVEEEYEKRSQSGRKIIGNGRLSGGSAR